MAEARLLAFQWSLAPQDSNHWTPPANYLSGGLAEVLKDMGSLLWRYGSWDCRAHADQDTCSGKGVAGSCRWSDEPCCARHWIVVQIGDMRLGCTLSLGTRPKNNGVDRSSHGMIVCDGKSMALRGEVTRHAHVPLRCVVWSPCSLMDVEGGEGFPGLNVGGWTLVERLAEKPSGCSWLDIFLRVPNPTVARSTCLTCMHWASRPSCSHLAVH